MGYNGGPHFRFSEGFSLYLGADREARVRRSLAALQSGDRHLRAHAVTDASQTGIGRIKLGRVLLRQRRFAESEAEWLAGYEILAAQATPSVSWLQSARADLAAVYDALGRPEEAGRYRAKLEAARKELRAGSPTALL